MAHVLSSISSTESNYQDLSSRMSDLEDEYRSSSKHARERQNEELENLRKTQRADLRKQEDEYTRTIARTKDTAAETLGRERELSRNERAEQMSKLYDRNGQVRRDALETLQEERASTSRQVDELGKNYNDRTIANEKAAKARTDALDSAYERKIDQTTRTLRDSHADETQRYREQTSAMGGFKKDYDKDHANGRADAYKELESEYRSQAQVADDLYRREIASRGRQEHETDQHFQRIHNESLKDKDRHYARVIAEQHLSNHHDQKEAEAVFDKNYKQAQLRNRLDRQHADQAMEQRTESLHSKHQDDLKRMTKTYRNTMNQEKESLDFKKSQLQKHLNYVSTTDDIAAISPAAEQRLRESVNADYQKSLEAETQRNANRADHTREEKDRLVQGNLAQYQKQLADTRRSNLTERQIEKNELLQSLADTKYLSDVQVRDQETNHRREFEKLDKTHAQALNRQRQTYEELLQNTKHDADARLLGARQELEFKSKMAQRSFSQRQNELIRGYETKLADQKLEFETRVQETKAESEQRIRETERQSKQALAEQAQGFDQRIAQTIQQQQERERLVTANHEEEMDKIRRSNALLIRKKS